MPTKLDDGENLRFLYACFKTTEPNRVDYVKVGQEFGIRDAAARMRLNRLREALNGKPSGSSPKARREHKREVRKAAEKSGGKEGLDARWAGANDGDDDEEMRVGGDAKKEEEEEADGDDNVKKKEEEVDGDEDWKMLPEAPAPVFSVGPEMQGQVLFDRGNMATATPPPAPQYQVPNNTTPQMPAYSNAPSYAYSTPQVAIPATPYIHSSSWSYHPEQEPQQQQQWHASSLPQASNCDVIESMQPPTPTS